MRPNPCYTPPHPDRTLAATRAEVLRLLANQPLTLSALQRELGDTPTAMRALADLDNEGLVTVGPAGAFITDGGRTHIAKVALEAAVLRSIATNPHDDGALRAEFGDVTDALRMLKARGHVFCKLGVWCATDRGRVAMHEAEVGA